MAKKHKNSTEKRRISDKLQNTGSVVAAHTTFTGNLRGQDDITVSGSFKGDIDSSGSVRISSGGKIKGNISGRFVVIAGNLEGDINKADQVEVQGTARINGNITASRLSIAEGSFIQGKIHMPPKKEPHRFTEKRNTGPETNKKT